MYRERNFRKQLLSYTAAILITGYGAATNAVGQTGSTTLPADCSAYASVPLPPEAEKAAVPKAAPGCASYRSYRGIGRPVDYSAARACAWQERLAQKADLGQNPNEGAAWVVGGSLILADIYFNGAGVKRNIPLAMRFACESEAGMAMLALPEIQKLNGSLPTDGPFEFCDYAETTFTENFCSGYAAEIADDRRHRYYDSLRSAMSPEQRAAFEKLVAAENAYIVAHASEVYQGGSIHNIRTIFSQEILEDLFHTEVVHFERGKWPALSADQIRRADALLSREDEKTLKRLRAQTKEETEDSRVTADDLTKVERAWENYRDAWVAFARVRYPAHVEAIRAEVILDRYRLLKTIG
ncbi:MAG TPA: lysozyme inhibitor LprI family protein [Acidobacteriaceae bacterium]|nr:lysozyme inhibitor LprI family protein [Acidobacteriaceae bacterium]